MRKLATRKGKENATRSLLNDEYIIDHCKLTAVDLSRQKELYADPKVIQQIEFQRKLKNTDGENAHGTKYMI